MIMRNFFRKFHLWVSVPFGIVIAITCFTGALLVFENEITALCRNDVANVAPVGEALPLDVIVRKVAATLPADVEVKSVVVSHSPSEAYRVNLSKPRNSAVYVNQYTGEVTGKDERLPFFSTVFRLHRWLMDSNPGDGAIFWGKMVVGASTLAFVVLLFTGLVIWWPRNRKLLSSRLQIVLKKGKPRFWYDLHVAGGFYALLLLLVMALTGLTWSFEWYKDGVYALFGANETENVAAVVKENKKTTVGSAVCPGSCGTCTLPVCVYSADDKGATAEQGSTVKWNVDAVTAATTVVEAKYVDAEPVVSIADVDGVTAATIVDAQSGATAIVDGNSGATPQSIPLQENVSCSWQTAFENVVARVPGYGTITVSAGTVSVKTSVCGNVRAADKYMFDDKGGITKVEPYKDSDRKSKLGGWVYSLHTGSWCGLFSRVLSFLAALLGATLPLTGYYLWIRRLYGKHKARQ